MSNDKQLHLIVGFLIAFAGGLMLSDYSLGLALATLAGVGKELYDYISYGLYDTSDMITTWIGGLVGTAVAMGILG